MGKGGEWGGDGFGSLAGFSENHHKGGTMDVTGTTMTPGSKDGQYDDRGDRVTTQKSAEAYLSRK